MTGVERVANAFKNIGLVNWEKQANELKATLEETETRLTAKVLDSRLYFLLRCRVH